MTDIRGERQKLKAQGLDIIERGTWGAAQSYTSARDVVMPAVGFFLHVSVTIDNGDRPGTEHGDMRTIERIGQERFGIGFPYNAAAFDTGRLYEGQPLTRRGAHTVNDKNTPGYTQSSSGSLNPWYRALVLPQTCPDDVTDAQIDSAARWAAAQIRAGLAVPGASWSGHRDVAWKDCPCDNGYSRLPELNRLTRHYAQHGLDGGFLMALTDKQQQEIYKQLTADGDLDATVAARVRKIGRDLNPDVDEILRQVTADGDTDPTVAARVRKVGRDLDSRMDRVEEVLARIEAKLDT